jgi:hypothetical protein
MFVDAETRSVPSRSPGTTSMETCVNFISVAAETCLASRCLVMDVSAVSLTAHFGVQASCHNIMSQV